MRTRATLPVLFSVVIVDLIGFGIVLPVLPFYAREFGASATTLGFLLMVYASAQFACAPLWGRLSDRLGRRRIMLFTVAGTAVALLLAGLADSLTQLFAARLLAGGFAANVGVASAFIADVTEEHERTRWMGMLGASFGVGFLLGPAIGGALAPLGYQVPILVAAAMAAFNLGYAWLALPDLRAASRGAGAAGEGAGPGRMAVLRDPRVRRLCLAYFALSVAMTQLETVFAFFMMDRFGYDARQVAFILVMMAVIMGTIQGGGMKALAARFRERALVTSGGCLLAASLLGVPLAHALAPLLVLLAVASVGRAIVQPPLMSLTSLAAAPEERGAVMGTFQSSASLARVVGPVAAGWLYDLWLPAPFCLASLLTLIVAGMGATLSDRGTRRG